MIVVVRSDYRTLARVQFESAVPSPGSGLLARFERTSSRARLASTHFPAHGDTFSRIRNFCRLLVGWSIPLKLRQKSASGFTDAFHVLLLRHGNHHDRGVFGNVRISVGEVRNVER